MSHAAGVSSPYTGGHTTITAEQLLKQLSVHEDLRETLKLNANEWKRRCEVAEADRDNWKRRCEQAEQRLKQYGEEPDSLSSLSWEGGIYQGYVRHGIFVRNMRPHGEGTLRTMDEKETLYQGQWNDGKKEGRGQELRNGRVIYDGQWLEGKRHGQGKAYTSSGVVWFSGEWKNDRIDKGTLFPEGRWGEGAKADGTPKYPVAATEWQAGDKLPKTNVQGTGRNLPQFLEGYGLAEFLPDDAM
ncbi:unnamed protein product [Vitrella brassicaformis CCMP3155]|uniref:MORN repeat-containing protein 5 n=1 Tax=Vitrella brassicaformis (strain CCMP3155) TaxID=1169540 RepID=A0A0G4FXG4_VITBC|nr:unnamed protein product [Vitrella brassicaformis CCMP3155]|eukprot:CEM19555.1 unnamed protein product [Vitrella brassicaformis CCMP3155]